MSDDQNNQKAIDFGSITPEQLLHMATPMLGMSSDELALMLNVVLGVLVERNGGAATAELLLEIAENMNLFAVRAASDARN